MKLYEVNNAIDELFENAVDPETGEILMDADEVMAQLESLQMEKNRILEYLAKLVLNTRSEEEAIREEEVRLKSRRDRMANKERRLMDILDKECAGEKTDLGIATVSYRKTSRVDVDDHVAVEWLQKNDYDDCLIYAEPKVAKNEVKKLMKAGKDIPGCKIIEDRSCSLR